MDAASGGFVWPFLYPDSEWDFRLSHVHSINVSGHKFGLVYPGVGWLIFREPEDLCEDLVFEENYLGKTDATFTLNFSTGSAMVLAQDYNLIRLGREGYKYMMDMMQQNARVLAEHLTACGDFELIGLDDEQLPLVAFRLAEPRSYNEFDIAWQLSAERGWDGARVHAPAECAARDHDARPGQGDAQPRDGRHARRRHSAGLPDARRQGRGSRVRAPAGENLDGVLRRQL